MRAVTLLSDTLFTIMRHWLLQATQLPEVIQAHPNAPRPATDYGSINLINSGQIGFTRDFTELSDDIRDINDGFPGGSFENAPLLAYTQSSRKWTFQFDVFSEDPVDTLNRLNVWHHTAEGQLWVFPAIIHSISDIRRIPDIVENAWHERATVDIEIHSWIWTLRTEDASEEFLGGVPVDIVDPATVNIFEVDSNRELQTNLNPLPLRSVPLADKLAEIK